MGIQVGDIVKVAIWSYGFPVPAKYRHLYDYGPGKSVVFNSKAKPVPENHGFVWKVVHIWDTGWLCVQNINTGTWLFSMPPHSFTKEQPLSEK